MEINEKIVNKGTNVYKTLENDPQYFGGYLNMARHNIFLIINQLTEVFDYLKSDEGSKFSVLSDDEQITSPKHILSQIFDPSIKKFEQERVRVYRYLVKRHHLPFLKIFDPENVNLKDDYSGVDYHRLHRFILLSLKLLDDLRNSYSHYLAIDDKGNRIVNRNNDVEPSLKQDIKLLFKNAPEYSFLRHQETHSEDDYKHLEKYLIFEKNTGLFTDQGFYFFINLFLERNQAVKFLKRFKGFKNETTPPFRATIKAFTSYALKLPDVRLGNENPRFSLLMDMLTELNKCPRELFNHLTEKDKKEFEPLLNDAEKRNVILNSTNYEAISDDEIDQTINELSALKRYNDRFPYFALRFLDETDAFKNIRFQITIGKLIVNRYDKEIAGVVQDRRLIKTIHAFGKLSDFADNETKVLAALKKDIPGDDSIRFEQFAPHYNTNNNKIAFYIFDPNDDKLKYPSVFENKAANTDAHNKPTGFISLHDLPKLLLLAHLVPNEPEQLICDFIRNTNPELLDKQLLDTIRQRAHYNPSTFTKRIPNEKVLIGKKGVQYLNKKSEDDLLKELNVSKAELLELDKQSLLKKTKNKKQFEHIAQIKYQHLLSERIEELKKHLPGDLKFDMLPARILDYLMKIEDADTVKQIHHKIKAIRDEAKQLTKEIEKPQSERQIKLGELVTFIARDIIKMVVSKEVKDKITTPYYNKLQNKIAYFSLNQKELIAICEELNLFNNREGHVFLSKNGILNSSGIIDFALYYLKAKDRWIESTLLKKGKTGGYLLPHDKSIPLSLQKINTEVNTFDFHQWLKAKSQMPVDLPRSLFDEQLGKILKGRLTTKGVSYNEGDTFSVLLGKYLDNDSQAFYHYTRSYRINKELVELQIQGKTGKDLKAKYRIPVEKNEKLIRFTQTKDRILKLLCDQLLTLDNTIGLQGGFNLTNIHPNARYNPLKHPATFQQSIIRKGNAVYCNIIAKDTEDQIKSVERFELLQTEAQREAYPDQKWYQWTIKDFGRFKRFVKDRRIPDLTSYFQNKDIPFDLLEFQIREYNKYREAIFDASFKLEKHISHFDFEGIKRLELNNNRLLKTHRPKDFHDIQFHIYLEWLDIKHIKYNKELVNECRNKYAHSQCPQLKEIPLISTEQMMDFEAHKHIKDYKHGSGISIPEKICSLYTMEIDKIIENINRLQKKNNTTMEGI